MGNNCCSSEAGQDENNDFRVQSQGGVQNESLNAQGSRGNLRNMGSQDLNPVEHLPKQGDSAFIVYTQPFPPTLSPQAIQCEGTLPNLPPPVVQPGDFIYPESHQPYLISATQDIYKGQFYQGKPHGFGEMYTPTNQANTPNSGLETVNRGNTVATVGIGANNSKINDNANYTSDPTTLQQMSFIKYIGSFKNGQKNGYGRAIYPDGSVYMGEWMNDLPHGKGKLKSLTVNGQEEFYDGDWQAGQMHGLGMQQWRDGTIYQGGFSNGRKHGKGVFSWPDGNKYEGAYKEDLRDGYGTFTWNTQQRYEGYWKNGTQHGIGKMTSKNGTVKEGRWENGQNVEWYNKTTADGKDKMAMEQQFSKGEQKFNNAGTGAQ